MMKRSDFLKKSLAISTFSFGLPTFKAWSAASHITRPPRLRSGDRIGLVAPAGIIYDEAEFFRMQKQLESFGFTCEFGTHVRNRHGYLAGSDEDRAADLNAMFENPEINGIMAVRGGWGCSRILPHLDFDMIAENPKMYCGFSDNTTLHHAFLNYCGLQTFHGPNSNSEWTDLTKGSFQTVMIDAEPVTYESNSEVSTLVPGKTIGRLLGGNLSILTTTLGTQYQSDFEDALLFVEDIGEDTYKIDRMMAHLEQAGILESMSGFVFGKCTDCSAGSSPTFSMREVLDHYLNRYEVPAVFNVDIGHEPDNFTIPMGAMAELNADEGVLRLLEPAVE